MLTTLSQHTAYVKTAAAAAGHLSQLSQVACMFDNHNVNRTIITLRADSNNVTLNGWVSLT